jgi:hypothetical protein
MAAEADAASASGASVTAMASSFFMARLLLVLACSGAG